MRPPFGYLGRRFLLCRLIWMTRPRRDLQRPSELVPISVLVLKENRSVICGCVRKPRRGVFVTRPYF
jgi:hypothetical protein